MQQQHESGQQLVQAVRGQEATMGHGQMKFWEAPEIYLLSWPTIDTTTGWCDRGCNFSQYTPAADLLSEAAGRACYWSYGKGRKTNAEYLANIISSGHGSVLEHPTWTFGLKGISRSLSHELVRHRHLAFSQLSQRYVTEDPEFVVPPGINEDQCPSFYEFCEHAACEYKRQLSWGADNKSGRAVARSVLPNATATRIVVTGNGRALRNMLALRGTAHAEAEFRRLAVAWTKLMKTLAPNIFADFEIRTEDGQEVVYTPHPKV